MPAQVSKIMIKLLSDSLIRRYTPPTCTLEIWATRSPLSFWSERQLVKELRFELRFDDPRLPEEEQITIKGDRAQLQQLGDVVGSYVQNFLQQPSLQIPPALPAQATESATDPAIASLTLTDEEDRTTATQQHALVALSSAPILRPIGLISHELLFGSLTANSSKPAIQLSASQLFDLAETLEQFNAEIDALPALDKIKKRKTTAVWASTAAAAIALLAVGLATFGTRIFQASNQPSDIASNQSSKPQSNVTDLAPIVPPAPTNEPVPSPTMPSSLQNRDTLPPPSSVNEPTQNSNQNSVAPVLPPTPSLPTSASTPSSSSEQSTIAVVPKETPQKTQSSSPKPSTPSTEQMPTSTEKPKLPELPSLEANETSTVAENPADVSPTRSRSSNQTAVVPSDTTPSTFSGETDSNLLDTIPQVAETRQYFQERWQVPDGLNQRLEYRLVVDREGAIAQIVPLGRAANIYLDRTQMPLMGTPFVSPLEASQEATIRLVLNPDGSVKTFLED